MQYPQRRMFIIIVSVIVAACIIFFGVYALKKSDAPSGQADTQPQQADSSINTAKRLEEEANSLITTDPVKAQQKYEEAAEVYTKSEAPDKAFEMKNNAAVAELNAETVESEPQDSPSGLTAGTQ